MLGSDAVQPNRRTAGFYLRVHGIALAVAFDAAGLKPENLDQKVVRGRYILVNEESYQSFDRRHIRSHTATT